MVRATVKESQAKARATRARKAAAAAVAEVDPVARVLVDVSLAHLDRTFDYAVPETMAEAARPGARVKVRFAGQDVDGFVVARSGASDHTGSLTPLRRVVSDEPVLAPAVADLAGGARRALRRRARRRAPAGGAAPARDHREAAVARPRPATASGTPQRPTAAWGDYEHAEAFPPPCHRRRCPARGLERRARRRLAAAARARGGERSRAPVAEP